MTRALWQARIRGAAYVWAPMLLVVALAAPSVDFLLPSYYCHLGESYQPLRALRFFHSLGGDFHKYGPVPNFLLAPGYSLSLGWWWLNGSFAAPSGDFPYGFQHPLEQISFLILQGRLVFLALFVGLFASLLVALRRATSNLWAIALAFLFCVATNYSAVGYAAFTRPDGPMLAFLGASLGVYVRIVYDGLTTRRGVWLSLLAVLAISSKEIAGPCYVLPYLGLGVAVAAECRRDPARRPALVRSVVWTLVSGVGAYVLLNIVYAPATWLLRMEHWLGGSGADSAVWGGVSSGEMTPFGFALFLCGTALNTLGPGGVAVAAIALASLAGTRARHGLLLVLPFLSFLLLGLIPIGYGADYFTDVATVTLVPPVAVGLAQLFETLESRVPRALLRAGIASALALNLVYANFAWIRLDGLFPRAVERELAAHPPGSATISLPDVYAEVPGKSRLGWLGYQVDPRSLRELIDAAPESRPDRIYLSSGLRGFLEDAVRQPARAEMLRAEGLDVTGWTGIESLGYRRARTLEVETPAWFVFDWMPSVALWKGISAVDVYERVSPPAANGVPGG